MITRRDQIDLKKGKDEEPKQAPNDTEAGAETGAGSPKAKAKAKAKGRAKGKAKAKAKASPKVRMTPKRKARKGAVEEAANAPGTPERRVLFQDDQGAAAPAEDGQPADTQPQGGEGDAAPPGRSKGKVRRGGGEAGQDAEAKVAPAPKRARRARAADPVEVATKHFKEDALDDPSLRGIFMQNFKKMENMPWDDLKASLINQNAVKMEKAQVNMYWSRVAGGVKLLTDPAKPEIHYFSFRVSTFNNRMVAAYLAALLFVSGLQSPLNQLFIKRCGHLKFCL